MKMETKNYLANSAVFNKHAHCNQRSTSSDKCKQSVSDLSNNVTKEDPNLVGKCDIKSEEEEHNLKTVNKRNVTLGSEEDRVERRNESYRRYRERNREALRQRSRNYYSRKSQEAKALRFDPTVDKNELNAKLERKNELRREYRRKNRDYINERNRVCRNRRQERKKEAMVDDAVSNNHRVVHGTRADGATAVSKHAEIPKRLSSTKQSGSYTSKMDQSSITSGTIIKEELNIEDEDAAQLNKGGKVRKSNEEVQRDDSEVGLWMWLRSPNNQQAENSGANGATCEDEILGI